MNLEQAHLIRSYGRPHELEVRDWHRVRGGHRQGEIVVALKGPHWALPHALAGLLVNGTEDERRMAADAVRELATEILPFDLVWY